MGRRSAALALAAWVSAALAWPAAALLWPAAALAQGSATPLIQQSGSANPLSPFNNQAPVAPTTTTTPTVTTATTSTSGGTLSGTDGVAIGIGAVLVLGGISFFIWRDARRRAPVRQRATAVAAGGPGARQRTKGRKLSPAERRRRKRGKAR